MVKDLFSSERICIAQRAQNWREAITLAAQPLLADGSITPLYVERMIKNVEKHGPYIVLTSRFALPHASGEGCVDRVSLSLLQVQEPVDLMGKPVNIFLVLATPDSTSHIQALAQLMELLYDPANLELLATGSKEDILALVTSI